MIRLTNLADYAVVLMCEIAQADCRMNAQGLSEITHIPVPTVSKILNTLSKNTLLASKRGIGGGFCLGKPITAISVAEIVEAIDGPIAMTACAEKPIGDCGFDQICCMRSRWQVINHSVRSALDQIKLSDLLGPVEKSPFFTALSIQTAVADTPLASNLKE